MIIGPVRELFRTDIGGFLLAMDVVIMWSSRGERREDSSEKGGSPFGYDVRGNVKL